MVQEAAMNGLGQHDLWRMAELELATRRAEADHQRLLRHVHEARPGSARLAVGVFGRGLVRLGERLERASGTRRMRPDGALRLGTPTAS